MFTYSFTVPNGSYEVRLHFAENFFGPNGRQFHVEVEGIRFFTNLDVAAEAGGTGRALMKTLTTRVTDGQVNIALPHGALDNPLISALEIISTDNPTTPVGLALNAKSGSQVNLAWSASMGTPAIAAYVVERCEGATCTNFATVASPSGTSYSDSGLTALTTYRYRVRAVDTTGRQSAPSEVKSVKTSLTGAFTTTRINAGGAAYVDTSGNTWSADTGFNAGTTYTISSAVSGTSDSPLYQDGRTDATGGAALEYTIAAPNGSYNVNLLFAEPTFGPAGRRFHVDIEGARALTNLDVASEAGVRTALTKSATAQVTDGFLNIVFLHGTVQDPIIAAIEVTQASAADSTAPSIPTGLGAVTVTSSRIDLAWTASSDDTGVTGYVIERCEGASCTDFSEVTTTSATSRSDTGLQGGTTYRYRVRARDGASNFGTWSSIVSATTLAGDTQPPSPPADLAVIETSHSVVNLSWSASTDNIGVAAYRVERCEGTGCTTFSQIGTTAATTYSDTALAPGIVYRYRVRATDVVPNFSTYSSIVTASTVAGSADTQPPGAPGSLSVQPQAGNQINLSWTAATDNVGVTAYFIERCLGSACTNFAQIASIAPATTYGDSDLSPSATYRYRIRARDADLNFGPYSAIASTSTMEGVGTAGSATYEYDSAGRLKRVTIVPN